MKMPLWMHFAIALLLIALAFLAETLTCILNLPDGVNHPGVQSNIKERYALRGQCDGKARN